MYLFIYFSSCPQQKSHFVVDNWKNFKQIQKYTIKIKKNIHGFHVPISNLLSY